MNGNSQTDIPLTPQQYPARCDCTEEEYRELIERFAGTERRTFGESLDQEWPPTDQAGNVYPIFFTPDDLNKDGNLEDTNGDDYRPFTGNIEPVAHHGEYDRCGTPVAKWRQRYPSVRYCKAPAFDGMTFCLKHRNRIDPTNLPTMADETLDNLGSAEELMQTGLFTQTIDHFYSNLDPLKKLVGWGTFESLMGESSYEFGIEYEPRKFDFSEADVQPEGVNEDGILTVKCGYLTQHVDPALSLYVAAMMGLQMVTVQPRIMYENEAEGERMMETKTVEHAQLTAPTENNPSQDFQTLETWTEHHLNLPLSRLVTDRPKLLERGGVGTDADEGSDSISGEEIVFDIEASPDGDIETTEDTGTDPNAFDGMEAASEEIVGHIEDRDNE